MLVWYPSPSLSFYRIMESAGFRTIMNIARQPFIRNSSAILVTAGECLKGDRISRKNNKNQTVQN